MEKVFVSNVSQYTGPGVVNQLSRCGYQVICHDRTFTDEATRNRFASEHNVIALAAQQPEAIVEELEQIGEVGRFVFNDVHPNSPKPFEEISLKELKAAQAALFDFPFHLSQLVLPQLKTQKAGAIVFVTSARQLQPEAGFALATSIRAGVTALALAVAREAAPFGVQVNALQPNYLYSEVYYPKARFIDTEEGRAEISAKVPMGRLGTPDEFGALVEFYISGRSSFTTGQVINFTGGWP